MLKIGGKPVLSTPVCQSQVCLLQLHSVSAAGFEPANRYGCLVVSQLRFTFRHAPKIVKVIA